MILTSINERTNELDISGVVYAPHRVCLWSLRFVLFFVDVVSFDVRQFSNYIRPIYLSFPINGFSDRWFSLPSERSQTQNELNNNKIDLISIAKKKEVK